MPDIELARVTISEKIRRGSFPLMPRNAAIALGLFLCALVPLFWRIGAKPLWLDEVLTLNRASLPFPRLVHNSFVNHHMPSYFLLIKGVLHFGHSPALLRAPSALFGAATVAMTFLAAARLAGRRAGIAAAALLLLSPAFVAYSQEARSYTLIMALIVIALYGLIGIAMAAGVGMKAQRRDWVLYVMGTAGGLIVLGDAALWWLVSAIAMIPIIAASPGERRALAMRWTVACLLIAAIAAPFYLVMDRTVHGNFTHGFVWIPALDLQRVWAVLASVYFERIGDMVSFHLMQTGLPMAVYGLAGAGMAGLALFGIWRLRRQRGVQILLSLGVFLVPVLLILISLHRPVLLGRYMLWTLIPFAMLGGVGMVGLWERWRMPLSAAFAALLAVNLAPYYSSHTKPRWDVAAKILASDMRPGDRLLFSDGSATIVMRASLPAAEADRMFSHATWKVSAAEAAKAAGHRVWVIYGRAGQGLEASWPQFVTKTAGLGDPTMFDTAGRRIRIELFDPAAEGAPVACAGPQPLAAAESASLPQSLSKRCS